MVMGSEGVLSAISEGKLVVDVKMPEISLPPIEVKMIFNHSKFEGLVRAEVQSQMRVVR